jgi:hypothetical protein
LALCDDDGRLAVCDEEGRLALCDEDGRFALGDDCRSPDGPVGLSPEFPEERGVVDAERFGVDADRLAVEDERSDADRFCAAAVRCEAAVDRFAPDALVPEP